MFWAAFMIGMVAGMPVGALAYWNGFRKGFRG